jgi:hypothetical protein
MFLNQKLNIKQNKTMKETLMRQIIAKQDEYKKLLEDELTEAVGIAHAHGWRSRKYEQGEQLRKELAALLQQLKQTNSVMKSKGEIVKSVEHIFENTKRIHGNSEVIDWQKIAIHKSVSYILSELADLKSQLNQAEVEPKELAEIKGGNKGCGNCRHRLKPTEEYPCNTCLTV